MATSPVEKFSCITQLGDYIVGYLKDGWTKEIFIKARTPEDGMFKVQKILGDICSVTYIERI